MDTTHDRDAAPSRSTPRARLGADARWLRGLPAMALALALALCALAAPSAAQAQIHPTRLRSSALGVADGQYARLNAYFVKAMPGTSELPPGPCRVTLRFVDATGAVAAESVVSLDRGRAAFLDFAPRGLRPGERATVRADVIAEPDARGVVPAMLPSIEVIDAATGRTGPVDPGSIRGFNPQPEPPGDLPLIGLASQQVARVSASYLGRPSDSGLPPGPCVVSLALLSGDGAVVVSREFTVAPGQTATLDLAAGSLPAGIRRRLSARVTSDGRAQGVVTPSVEIFDASTGRSAAVLPANLVQSWGWE